MKKLIKLFAVALSFAFVSGMAVSADSGNKLLIDRKPQKSDSSTVTVSLASDFTCAGIQGVLNYDTENLTFVSAEIPEELGTRNTAENSVKEVNGGLKIAVIGNIAEGTEGKFITLTFSASGNTAPSAFTFTNTVFSDTTGSTLTAESAEVVYGDVCEDYLINIKDLIRYKKYLAGSVDSINQLNADCNHNGSAELNDMVSLKKFLLGAIESF